MALQSWRLQQEKYVTTLPGEKKKSINALFQDIFADSSDINKQIKLYTTE